MFAKTFCNTLIASTLLVGASILVSPAAMAQDSGEVGGTVPTASTLLFNAPADLSEDLTDGTLAMGNLDIRNNNLAGWTLEVRSANNGQLHRSTGPGSTDIDADTYISYSNLTATGAPVGSPTTSLLSITTSDADFVVAPYAENFASTTGGNIAIAATVAVSGSVDGAPVARGSLPTGEYKDTLTFTLSSN